MTSLIVHHEARIELISYHRHEQLKREIYDWLLHYEDKQNHKTNVKAVMTEWNLTSPEIQILKDFIIKSLSHLPENLGWGRPGDFEFQSLWANIYRHGEYTLSHSHVPVDLTMIYFLTAHEGDAPLLLEDSKTRIYPEEGLMALFPGYVCHSVPKHMSHHERITLSGDINRIRN